MVTRKLKILVFFLLFFFIPFFVKADHGGQKTTFFVDSFYDFQKRSQLSAVLIRITSSLYFYLDEKWWNSLDSQFQKEVKIALQQLGEEFDQRIYPILTSIFGFEWRPGIDQDSHITVLFHPMIEEVGGYINTRDEYLRIQNPFSNQREMIYLNSTYLTTPLIKSFLAHEFLHLITFNQKEKRFGVSEQNWLNELRAEYVPTLLGYDNDYKNSNLRKRVEIFLQFPNDSLIEWKNKKADYGVLNLFAQYLVDHYGIDILVDSLKSEKIGIFSLNEALKKYGFVENFSQVFTNWTIAVFLNDCQINEKYCYKSSNLQNIKIAPQVNFLPLKGKSTLALTEEIKNWSAHWYKFVGGKGDLKIEFAGFPGAIFQVPYIIEYKNGERKVGFLELDNFQKGNLIIKDFGNEIVSFVLIISLVNENSDFNENGRSYPFFWSVSTQSIFFENEEQKNKKNNNFSSPKDVQLLLKKIEFLEKQLAVLRAQLKEVLGGEFFSQQNKRKSPANLYQNLKYGDKGKQVKLLQKWLAQDSTVYPEGLITGYFGSLTKKAVIRFQEKYAQDILFPWGLSQGTGFVGITTRKKLNQLYAQNFY